tara:strand:- start:5 stop:502 length:498 start_codon:yes stop_codon:yes gene_type:complete
MEINLELLSKLPDDLLVIIFKNIRPSIKYCLNKKYFKKYFKYRFAYINNFKYNFSIVDKYMIKNYSYIKYLIVNDCKLILENIINNKIANDKTRFIINKNIKFENIKFANFIDMCYYYSKKYKSKNILNLIDTIIDFYTNEYHVVIYEKNKNYKYTKNKNYKWCA